MKIAVCDDETEIAEKFEEYFIKLNEKYADLEWDIYSDGKTLAEEYMNGKTYDMIYLDMEMKHMNGIETANKIRETDTHVIIVFVTCYEKYAINCFECQPFRFLLKPVSYETIEDIMQKALKKLSEGPETFIFKERNNKIRLFCDDIIFFENRLHAVNIITKEKRYITNMPLYEVCNKLNMKNFVKVHKSFIINLAYVKAISENSVLMYDHSENIPLSRTYKQDLNIKFVKYNERKYQI